MRDDALPHVTMVISAYNEEKVLPGKIANCKEIDYPQHKMSFLFGSDGSDDRTNEILKQIDDKQFNVFISHQRGGKVQMLNTLVPKAESEVVVFSDANTIYEPDAIRQMVQLFTDRRVGCVIGKQILYAPANDEQACQTESIYWRYENRIKELESTFGAVPSVNGSIFAIRRDLYRELPSHAITEDQVLGLKIMTEGHRGLFANKAIGWEPVSTMTDELRRRIRISAGNFQSLFLVPKILNPRCGWVTFAFISHKLLRWLVPFFLVAMLTSNILLVGEPFYGSTMILQGLFYISGIIGAAVPKLTGVCKILTIPKYFLAMNFAIVLGLVRFISGKQKVTWFKAARP
jgi:cellulose synthase/poly-beta-1,6-N-acetylglucosamine synthase-like glycosyltransferase